MSEIKLLNCPFCGGEAFVRKNKDLMGTYSVYCANDECSVSPTISAYSKEMVIKIWNTRKPMERIIERLEEEKHSTLPTFDEDGYCNDDSWDVVDFDVAIEIVKEEGGIE